MNRSVTSPWLAQTPDSDAEIWVEPSAEAQFLLRYFGWLVAPSSTAEPRGIRAFRNWTVAPFTQLTFFSFDLQFHLFEVLHRRWPARVTHGVGMTVVVLLLLVIAAAAGGGVGLGLAAAVLAAWYAGVALKAGLPAWGFCSIVFLVALAAGALGIASAGVLSAGWAALLLVPASGFIAFGHSFEPSQPPRAFDSPEWVTLSDVLAGGANQGGGARVRTAWRFLVTWLSGFVNELWAAPRLLPYNLLALMFRAGYAPDRWTELRDRVDRAWASGNPALDYVGVGGSTYLRPPQD